MLLEHLKKVNTFTGLPLRLQESLLEIEVDKWAGTPSYRRRRNRAPRMCRGKLVRTAAAGFLLICYIRTITLYSIDEHSGLFKNYIKNT